MGLTLRLHPDAPVDPEPGEGIPVTAVSLSKDNSTLEVGSSEKLVAAVSPNNATNKAVTWSSTDETIAKVTTTGNVSAEKVGTVDIIVKTKDSDKTAICAYTITESNGE